MDGQERDVLRLQVTEKKEKKKKRKSEAAAVEAEEATGEL